LTWIETFSGRSFDLLDPTPDAVTLDDIAHALARQVRFLGHVDGFISVAEHALHVEWLIEARARSTWAEHLGPISHRGLAQFCFQALHHDSAEAYVGDLSAPMKQALRALANYPRSPLDKIEEAVQSAIWSHFKTEPPDWTRRRLIKHADLVLRAAERMVLMPHSTGEWDSLKGVVDLTDALDETVVQLLKRLRDPLWRDASFSTIKQRFIDRSIQLSAGMRRDQEER